MDNPGTRESRRFAFEWGELEVFGTGDPVPNTLNPIVAVTSQLETRFRPALLRVRRWLPGAYIAVWPENVPMPDDGGAGERALRLVKDVVLAEVHALSCLMCAARFQGIYPDLGVPLFGRHWQRIDWSADALAVETISPPLEFRLLLSFLLHEHDPGQHNPSVSDGMCWLASRPRAERWCCRRRGSQWAPSRYPAGL
ncbi:MULTISPECIES: hypothetical protein [unclassified Nocardia]|uniref:hypothetical protein n=1 Tax=unclassified Nocardia TaxID=2637762 RepID=UPI003678E24E